MYIVKISKDGVQKQENKLPTLGEATSWVATQKTQYEALGYDSIEDMDIDIQPYNDYREKRIAEYGSLGSQLDEMFHDYDAWKERIQSIKDKYPKQ